MQPVSSLGFYQKSTKYAEQCEKHPWNADASELLLKDFRKPVILMTKQEDIDKVYDVSKN